MGNVSQIRELCEQLLAAYQAKGQDPSSELLPGLPDGEISAQTSWFPSKLPEHLYALYRWRNGQPQGTWNTERVFWFRDMQFTSLERARFEYESMMDSYGVGNSRESEGIELRSCFPFASFNGGWYVMPCDGQDLDARHSYPVVSVFQGIGIHYFSLESMLKTCIEWILASTWRERHPELPRQAEMAIWQKHNPGLFGYAT